MDNIEAEEYGDRAHLTATVRGHLKSRENTNEKDIQFTAIWTLLKDNDGWKFTNQMWKDTPAEGSVF